jgi:hypothetical protein
MALQAAALKRPSIVILRERSDRRTCTYPPLLAHVLDGTIPYEPLMVEGQHHFSRRLPQQVTIRPHDGPDE